jgi:acyl carrier protein
LYNNPTFDEIGDSYIEKIFDAVGDDFNVRLCIKNISKSTIISSKAIVEDLNFIQPSPGEYENKFELQVNKTTRFDGFVLWINLYTVSDQVIDSLEEETSWLPLYFPLFYPAIEVFEGDIIKGKFIVSLSENGINPDYEIKGELIRVTGEHISFNLISEYHPKQKDDDQFYKKLFENRESAKSKSKSSISDDLKEYLGKQLPSYMIPNNIFVLKEFPITASGKIDRKALKDPKELGIRSGVEYVAPRNELEEKLAQIWKELLGVEQVGINDNFFELGGHSLLAMRLISAIRKEFEVELPIKDLFEYTTISELSRYLEVQLGNYSDTEDSEEFEVLVI